MTLNDKDSTTIVVINAGVSETSSTRTLLDQILRKVTADFAATGVHTQVSSIDLAPLATDIARSLVGGFANPAVQQAIDTLAQADAVVAATPVYKAGMSGLFKSFIDLVDNDLIIAVPTLLAATAGSARHAMVPDDHMRPLFTFLRTIITPTSIFASPEDWNTKDLSARIDRASHELVSLVNSPANTSITGGSRGGYSHQFAGNAKHADQSASEVNFDTDLMRLATGGTLPPR